MNKSMLDDALKDLPHYGELWEKKLYANPERPMVIIGLYPCQESNALKAPMFFSSVFLATHRGNVEVKFQIEGAKDYHEAGTLWRSFAEKAVRGAVDEMEKAERRIVVPSAEPPFPKKPVAANH